MNEVNEWARQTREQHEAVRDGLVAGSRFVGPEWPEMRAHTLIEYAERLLVSVQGYDVLASLYALADISTAASEIAGDVIEIAGKETKIPAKRLAEALNVPPSMLRGLRS